MPPRKAAAPSKAAPRTTGRAKTRLTDRNREPVSSDDDEVGAQLRAELRDRRRRTAKEPEPVLPEVADQQAPKNPPKNSSKNPPKSNPKNPPKNNPKSRVNNEKTASGPPSRPSKRKAVDTEGDGETPNGSDEPRNKKRKAEEPKESMPKKTKARKILGQKAPQNEVPNKRLEVYVFGEGSSGELGLGSRKYEGKKPIDVKRPRINHNLDPEEVGVVQIACGGMHVVALTHDQRILTWGVNDDKALGRDTYWEGPTRDVDDEEDDEEDEDDTGINPRESTPGEVDLGDIPEGTRFSQVAATDSASFVLTEYGDVYGWGTFRGSDGIIGFTEQVRIQPTPILIPDLKNISRLACGSNHVVAMDIHGKVITWGSGGQYQLGRKPLTRHGGPRAGLRPQPCAKFTSRHYAVHVGAGSYHSFYIDNHNRVWAWGLNNYSQTGLTDDTGKDDAMVLNPKIVESLADHDILQIVGGEHHSVACTRDGELVTWGRVDGHQVGHPTDLYNEDNAVFDDNGKPRILLEPTLVEGINAHFVAAGTDTSFVLNEAGKVYSWGFSANYQTGQGTTDDIEVPTLIDNTAIRGKKIIWSGAGGQYSVLAAHADPDLDDQLPNGH
ncbi:regulator of chromosome condensation 1/beta-lactamase-inhibitor protein II [Xylariaceae sp. FL0662B]|nr:regulator of chromosome condensation 1/beta-lactamase-inhibitor protein II [Xylariaceae sp. FL0662B]